MSAITPMSFPAWGYRRDVFRGVDWHTYSQLSQSLGEGQHIRLIYDGKDLEIMVTGNIHEILKELIGKILTAAAMGLDVDFVACGQATWKSARARGRPVLLFRAGEDPRGEGGRRPQVGRPRRLPPSRHGGRDRHLAPPGGSPIDLQRPARGRGLAIGQGREARHRAVAGRRFLRRRRAEAGSFPSPPMTCRGG